MYIDATGISPGDKARLMSPRMLIGESGNMQECTVQFWYHMYGDGIGKLNVYIKPADKNEEHTLLWSKSGNQLDEWHLGTVSFVWQRPDDFQV